uniref:hypothetical protein n=1 Tax=Algoriphagus sp. TaxID=1872435 RepID=UPI00404762B1
MNQQERNKKSGLSYMAMGNWQRFLYGTEDKLITEESKKRQEELLLSLEKPLTVLTFDGGHELNPSLLEKIINQGV